MRNLWASIQSDNQISPILEPLLSTLKLTLAVVLSGILIRAKMRQVLMFLLVVGMGVLKTECHNITKILLEHPEFSTFNHYLSVTHLADDINSRETITVCAVNNAAMSDLLAKRLTLAALKNVLSLHVLLDYFGAKKLHQITNGTVLTATMFQATGSAIGTSGFVNITDLKGGKVGFGPENTGGLGSTFVKSVREIPYNISVLQISSILTSPEAEAPSASQQNLTALLSGHGCKAFADALASSSSASKIYSDNLESGLTVFCPLDDPFKKFRPRFDNLTSDGKASLLEFHGVPVYLSLPMLRSNNGDQNTLATDNARNFEFTVQNDATAVTLKTKSVSAKIVGTLIDDQPLSIFTIDRVLIPKELFKNDTSHTATPAPAPAPTKTKKKKKLDTPEADVSPSDGPSDDSADSTADGSGAMKLAGVWSFVGCAILSVFVCGFV